MINLILCGGNGTRLWPISRKLFPKQFYKLFNKESLFQLTVKRNQNLCKSELIVSNEEQYFLASDQLSEIDIDKQSSFLLEPVGRNTAPAIALSCFMVDENDILLVTPSDHLIKNEQEYSKVVNRAKELASHGFLVTFGIKPNYPETGYGYIEANGEDVKSFKEKPSVSKAQEYLKKGNYYWNSGMFCFKAGVFLKEIKKYSPNIYETTLKAYENAKIGDDSKNKIVRVLLDDMINIPEESIDYALMEKSQILKVVESDISWSDLGSFDSLYEELPIDENGNTKNKNYVYVGSKNNLIIGENRYIASIDIEDLIIVDTPDALLISKKGSSQKVKDIVNITKEKKPELPNIHLTAHRPWGTYTILDDRENYKIKKIVVHPGKRLSLQKHFHRNEHWIVVSGTALVRVGEVETIVKQNESTYINMGEIHRLENPGKIPLVLIEAQIGEYTGEDDIVRIEDDFKRA